jgi:hypothetical protein
MLPNDILKLIFNQLDDFKDVNALKNVNSACFRVFMQNRDYFFAKSIKLVKTTSTNLFIKKDKHFEFKSYRGTRTFSRDSLNWYEIEAQNIRINFGTLYSGQYTPNLVIKTNLFTIGIGKHNKSYITIKSLPLDLRIEYDDIHYYNKNVRICKINFNNCDKTDAIRNFYEINNDVFRQLGSILENYREMIINRFNRQRRFHYSEKGEILYNSYHDMNGLQGRFIKRTPYKNSRKVDANYINGIPDGKYIAYDQSECKTFELSYDYGKLIGEYIIYNFDGSVMSKTPVEEVPLMSIYHAWKI